MKKKIKRKISSMNLRLHIIIKVKEYIYLKNINNLFKMTYRLSQETFRKLFSKYMTFKIEFKKCFNFYE